MITIKWFKHETDAANSEKLAILQQKFGFAGIGRWWRLLEVIAAKMDKTDKCSVEYPKNKWRELLGYDNNTHLARYLDHLATVGLLHCHDTGTSMSLSIPNLLNKRDNYTKDLVVTTKKLPSKEVEVEVEVEVDKDKDKEIYKEKSSRTQISDADFIFSLKNNIAYKSIDIDKELAKMDAWFLTPKGRGRKKSHKFILNWLNKCEREVQTQGGNEDARFNFLKENKGT